MIPVRWLPHRLAYSVQRLQVMLFCNLERPSVIASRIAEFEQLQIDQNQCRRLKGSYGFDHPKGVASRPFIIITLSGNARRRGYDSAGT
jgi:hypothetical protein